MDAAHVALVAVAAVAGGLVNAIAGGGSLLTFPALVAAGLPAIVANVTNTVALCPGYLGATLAQRRELVGQRSRALVIVPVAAAGGVGGALLLLHTPAASFEAIIPFLLVFAAVLVAAQEWLRAKLAARGRRAHTPWLAALAIAPAAIYGGYFGGAVSIIVLAALAVVLDDTLVRVNALKQAVSLAINVTAAIVFAVSARVDWAAAGVMAVGSLVGGALGGALASRVSAKLLRAGVIVVALGVAAVYFTRL